MQQDEFRRIDGAVIPLRQDTAERLIGHCFSEGDRPALAQAVALRMRRPVDPERLEIIRRGSFGIIGPVVGWKLFGPGIGARRSMAVESYHVVGSTLGIDWTMQISLQGVKGYPDTLERQEPYRLALPERLIGPWSQKRRRYHILSGETPSALAHRLSAELLILSTARQRGAFSI